MRRRILKKPQSRRDVLEIADYISRDSLAAADRFAAAVESSLELLHDFPEIGSPWEYSRIHQGLRFLNVKGFSDYLIFYRYTGRDVEVLRILHGGRDLENLLP